MSNHANKDPIFQFFGGRKSVGNLFFMKNTSPELVSLGKESLGEF